MTMPSSKCSSFKNDLESLSVKMSSFAEIRRRRRRRNRFVSYSESDYHSRGTPVKKSPVVFSSILKTLKQYNIRSKAAFGSEVMNIF